MALSALAALLEPILVPAALQVTPLASALSVALHGALAD
jgi:hypothetical protein